MTSWWRHRKNAGKLHFRSFSASRQIFFGILVKFTILYFSPSSLNLRVGFIFATCVPWLWHKPSLYRQEKSDVSIILLINSVIVNKSLLPRHQQMNILSHQMRKKESYCNNLIINYLIVLLFLLGRCSLHSARIIRIECRICCFF